ncbi:MAG: hypothetical protein KIS89_00885 [Dokdonella sp.]|nr:hypothetical protein [Dokdonella sp.]
MADFPCHLLTAAGARCQPRSGPTQQAAITIALHPFMLDGQPVDTLVQLDGIALDLGEPRRQAGRSHCFPVNPRKGYIDGSICLLHRHVPLDVSGLSFGAPDERTLPARLTGTLVFSAAGITTWSDTPLELAFALELPPTPAQIDAAIAAAIAATGARNVRDAGRAMAWLVREHPGWDDRSALHTRLCRHLPAAGEAS